jgi:phosphoribosylformylglycinamidine cyclo-ligase
MAGPEDARGLSYRDSGVDLDAAAESVDRIGAHVTSTWTDAVVGGFGGFGGALALPAGLREPVLVAGTDGVGTKLLLARALGREDGVGIDLVAMSVNDVLAQGARPLLFLDYIAVGRLDPVRVERLVAGVAEGCRRAGCALLGGETAELPGMYAPGDEDLAGFAVGVVERDAMLPAAPDRWVGGDAVIGLASTGPHSNGFSLIRAAVERAGVGWDTPLADLAGGEDESTLGEACLAPTEIYVRPILDVLEALPGRVRALAHITGGGLAENLARVVPAGWSARIDGRAWTRPPVFAALDALGQVSAEEQARAWNLGVGYVAVVEAAAAQAVLERLRGHRVAAWHIGDIEPAPGPDDHRVIIRS